MTRVIPFEAWHVDYIRTREPARFHQEREFWLLVEAQGGAQTVMVNDRIVMACGVVKSWEGSGSAWALLDQDAGRHALAVHRVALKVLASAHARGIRRIEASVICDGFDEGHRWVRALGFHLEAERMRAYYPDGQDCALYARVA